ncbi:MAG: hypothetical protein SOY68_06615 [Fusobacterium varium]|uniref:hypothetical protein n=1 Tax=Fusobacterium varium TaxID=856 RepID=UPI00242F331D|nr:hypothetical protein [Fusobacterium varium]MCI6034025.1 hypothetical protein [Fusobacterium varium]MDY4005567.1 hypothetical protein [Fusobacterium varium]
MKKLLLLAGLLVVAGSAFAEKVTNTSAEGTVDVYAQVLHNLSIETKPLDFGVLGINDEKTVSYNDSNAGEFTINAAKNSKIKLTITDDTEGGNSYSFSGNGSGIRLEREGNTKGKNSQNDNLHPIVKITDNKGNLLQSDTVSIVSSGNMHLLDKLVYKVHGTLKTNKEQNTGNYKGAIKVTAKYDSWPATTPAR